MKIVLLIVAVLAALAALVQVPEFLQLFAPDTPQNLFTTIRQRVLLHDIGIAAAIALAAGFGAAVLHRMGRQQAPVAGTNSLPPRAATTQRHCRHCAAPVGAHETICWKCHRPLGAEPPPQSAAQLRRRCSSCNTMVALDRAQCWNCGYRFPAEESPLSRLMPLAPASQPPTAPAEPAAELACAGCGRKRDADARLCAGCGRKFPGMG